MPVEFGKYHPIDTNNPVYLENPQIIFKWLRDNAPITWHPEYESWIIVKASDYELSKDIETFSKAGLNSALRKLQNDGINLGEYEYALAHFRELLQFLVHEERHLELRRMLTPFYTQKNILSEITHPIIDEACEFVFDTLETKTKRNEEIDWQMHFCIPFTGFLVNKTLGLAKENCIKYYELSMSILSFFTSVPDENSLREKCEAMVTLKQLYIPLIKEKRENMIEGEIFSELIKFRDNGRFKSDHELISSLILLTTNSFLTIVGILSNILNVFGEFPQIILQIRQDYNLLPNAIKEAIRYDGLGLFVNRIAKRDFELRGQKIKSGDQVLFFNASANWDEEVFECPEKFDIRRDLKKNYSFGLQNTRYSCIAVNYIELLCQNVFRMFLDRFSDFKVSLVLIPAKSPILKPTKKQIVKLKTLI